MRFLSAIDRKLVRDLIHLRGQGFAVAIIVACGVAIMIMALGTLSSLQVSKDTYYDRFRFAQIFVHVKRAPENLMPRIREIDGLSYAQSRITHFVTLNIDGFNDPVNGMMISIPVDRSSSLNRVFLQTGRWPAPRRYDEVVASKAFVDAHGFELGDHIEAIMNGKSRNLRLVGVGDSPEFIYTLGPGSFLPDDQRFGIFWMQRQALEALFDLDGAFNDMAAMLEPGANSASVIADLDRILAPYGSHGAFDRKDQLSNAFIESEMKQLKSMARVIPPIFLLISAALLNAILARLIATERQQIGILKAFGYTRFEIGWHYVKLAICITMVGLFIGFVLGAVLARMVTNLYAESFRFPILIYSLSSYAFIIAAVGSILAAIAGALTAALRAARLEPAEAMNPSPPVNYSRGGFQKWVARMPLDEPTRMVLRHITRWPGRSITTVLGIAAALGLLVGTLFSFDSIDDLMETFFFRTDPYEVSYTFAEARNENATREFSKLPGVLGVEPNRQVSVKMKAGQHNERAAVIGLMEGSSQKRLIGSNGTYNSVPNFGIVLTSQLAKMLDVTLGKSIEVEFLEGRRPTTNLPVTAIVEENIGAVAYINIDYLNRIMGDGHVVSGGYAKIDPSEYSAFQHSILQRPAIASVTMQSAALTSFEETLDETISIMMSIYALIGGAIAAGVVYNAARIALTERGRELASMRVLGFTNGEVSYILLGELAILLLAAIPIGTLMGISLAYAISFGLSSKLYRIPFVIEPSTFGCAVLIILIASVFSAMMVVRRINSLDLIAVLKTRE